MRGPSAERATGQTPRGRCATDTSDDRLGQRSRIRQHEGEGRQGGREGCAYARSRSSKAAPSLYISRDGRSITTQDPASIQDTIIRTTPGRQSLHSRHSALGLRLGSSGPGSVTTWPADPGPSTQPNTNKHTATTRPKGTMAATEAVQTCTTFCSLSVEALSQFKTRHPADTPFCSVEALSSIRLTRTLHTMARPRQKRPSEARVRPRVGPRLSLYGLTWSIVIASGRVERLGFSSECRCRADGYGYQSGMTRSILICRVLIRQFFVLLLIFRK